MDGDKTKLFVICGHGAGDPGACANGYQEAERVRALGKRIKELGGSNVMLGDVNRDYYADNGISKLTIAKDYQIIELHMDSAAASARGAHVIIKDGLNADQYDMALAKFISGIFPGRANTIVKRGDLSNPARAYAKGYSYRLMECGFISNATDVSIFNKNIDKIAKGILQCFGITAQTKPTASKPVSKPAAASASKPSSKVAQEAARYGMKIGTKDTVKKGFYISENATIYGGASYGVKIPSSIKKATTCYTCGGVRYDRGEWWVLANQIMSWVKVSETMVK